MNAPSAVPSEQLDLILDVTVPLTAQIGSCQLPMRDVLALQAGSVLQLDQEAQEPIELYIHDKRVARGEVVLVEDHFALKLTEILGMETPKAQAPDSEPAQKE